MRVVVNEDALEISLRKNKKIITIFTILMTTLLILTNPIVRSEFGNITQIQRMRWCWLKNRRLIYTHSMLYLSLFLIQASRTSMRYTVRQLLDLYHNLSDEWIPSMRNKDQKNRSHGIKTPRLTDIKFFRL